MRRRDIVGLGFAGASALTGIPPGRAQQPVRVVRIGMLSTSFGQRADGIRAFKAKLRSLGYTEGENLAFEMRDGEGRNDRVTAFAADLVERRVDLIVPLGPYAIQAARAATTTVPIVFTGIGTNFPLARSEGNTTGVAEELIESTTGRLALLKEESMQNRGGGSPIDPCFVASFGCQTALEGSRSRSAGGTAYQTRGRAPTILHALPTLLDTPTQSPRRHGKAAAGAGRPASPALLHG